MIPIRIRDHLLSFFSKNKHKIRFVNTGCEKNLVQEFPSDNQIILKKGLNIEWMPSQHTYPSNNDSVHKMLIIKKL